MSLKKALFKPAAFFKGVLLPLCESGDCTLREAVILSSVITRTSIPVLHSAAAMLKIAEMPYVATSLSSASPPSFSSSSSLLLLLLLLLRVLL